jgi:hypothetical protein
MMQNQHILVAVALVVVGLAAVAFLLKVMLAPLLTGLMRIPEQSKLRRREALLTELDRLLEQGPAPQVIRQISSLFLFDKLSTLELMEKAHTLNLSALGRLMSIAESSSKHLSNLAILEDLLANRLALQKGHYDVSQSAQKALIRSREDKRAVPAWALNEFNRKLSELEDKLKTNKSSLESQLRLAITELEKQGTSSSVTYH